MNPREKAHWLSKVNPYKQRYMWDAFREGARAFWQYGDNVPDGHTRGLNSRERGAFSKGYAAAEAAEKEEQ